MKKVTDVKSTNILIDTNILIHYAEDGFIERSGNPLGTLRDNGNILSVSCITGFELLCGENSEEKKKKFHQFLNYLPNLSVEQTHLSNGAVLASEYRRLCNNKKIKKTGDLIIAGLIVGYELGGEEVLLFTADRQDFCEPLWETVAYHLVQESGGGFVQHCFYLLKLNLEILNRDT